MTLPDSERRRPMLSRRTAVTGTVAAISSAALGRGRRLLAAETLTIRLDWSTHGCHAPFFLAIEKGWLKAAAIDLNIEDGNGSTTTVQLVGSGRFDLGHAALAPMAIGKAKGLPVVSIAGFIRKGDTGVLVPKEKNWTRPSDLIGQRCVYTAGSLEGPFVRPFFEKNNVSMSQVSLLNVEASAKVSTYLSGNVDAAISTVPFIIPIAAGKRDSTGILFADFGLDLPGFGLFAHGDQLKTKGAAIRRLTSVIAAAWIYILDGHEDEAANAIRVHRPNSPLPASALRGQIEAYRPFFHTAATVNTPIGLQSDDDWRKTISDMEAAGVIQLKTMPSNYFTNDFLDLGYGRDVVAL